jgi:hypothetical protein
MYQLRVARECAIIDSLGEDCLAFITLSIALCDDWLSFGAKGLRYCVQTYNIYKS